MKKIYKMENLDCANCARKIEDAIKKIEGVEDATVNFMTQKLTLTAADDRFGTALVEVEKTVRRVEPDCRLVLR